MDKLKFLIGFGLKKRLYKKSFWIVNGLLGLAIILLANLSSIIGLFQDEETVELTNVVIENRSDDQTFALAEEILTVMNRPFEEPRYTLVTEEDLDPETFWDQSDVAIWITFEGSLMQPDVTLFTQENNANFLIGQVQTILNQYQGISLANYDIQNPPPSEGDEDLLPPEVRMMLEGFASVLLLPMFILIILATQFLGVDIIEEKSSKAIEIIIASVPAKQHFIAKITSTSLFLVIQTLILSAFGFIGFMLNRAIVTEQLEEMSFIREILNAIPHWPSIIVVTFLFMIAGALLFLTLAALIAAVATTQEDYQQYQAPMVFLLLGGFYLGIFLPMAGADTALRVIAFIPFLSTFVAPVIYATGVISLTQVLISLVLLILASVLFLTLIAPIYRVAILSYEETKFFKRFRLYLKKAFSKK